MKGVFCDTGDLDSVTVNNNFFDNCQAGICFSNNGYSGFGFSSQNQYWRNFIIRDNFIKVVLSTEDWTQSGILFGRSPDEPYINNKTEYIYIISNRVCGATSTEGVNNIANYGVIVNTTGSFTDPRRTQGLRYGENFIDTKFKLSIK